MANNTVNVSNQVELQAALSNAISQPISCINITADVILLTSTLYLPKTLASLSKTLVINGNGATIEPSGSTVLTTLMDRSPLSQVEATGGMDACKFVIKDLQFNGKTGSGTGLELGASIGSTIQNCSFKSLTTGISLKYCPMTKITGCTASSIGGMCFVVGYGSWTGATTQNTQSGNTRFEQCRASTGGYGCFVIYASNNVVIDQCVVDSGSPNYHIYFDSIGSPLVKSFTVTNTQLSSPATLAGIKLKLAGGFAKIDGLYSDVDMTLVSAESAGGYPHLYVENVPWISTGTRFETLGASVVWSFNEVAQGENIFTISRWNNGVVPYFYYSEYFNESKGIITNLMKVNNKTIS